MTGKPGPTSVQACAVFWAVHSSSPSASCWCSGGHSPNHKKPRRLCVGASLHPPSARRLKAKRSAHRANLANPPPHPPRPDEGASPNDRLRASRPVRSAQPAPRGQRVQEAPVRAPVRSARLHEQVRATDPQHREAKQRPAPAQHAFVRPPAGSPAARSILRRAPSHASRPRNSNGPCAEWHSEVTHLKDFVAAQPARGLHLGGIALKLADQGT